MKNILKFFVLVVFALFLAGFSLSCKKQETPTPTLSPSASTSGSAKSDLTNLDPTSAKDEMRSNYNTAQQKATLWLGDAVPYSTSAKITPTLDWQDVIEVYTYGSNAQTAYWWTISISVRSKNYVRAIIPKEDYLGSSLKPIMLQYWKLNYIEAFQIAEKNGGKEWREKQQNANYQVTATLAMGDPNNYLYWIVEYQKTDGSDEKSVQINAFNGEVVEQEI